jgi:hypothetical protein
MEGKEIIGLTEKPSSQNTGAKDFSQFAPFWCNIFKIREIDHLEDRFGLTDVYPGGIPMHQLATFPAKTKFSLILIFFCSLVLPVHGAEFHDYPCESDLIEIMFIQESVVRLMGPIPEDLSGLNATDGVEYTLMAHGGGEWSRLTDLPEPLLDEMAMIAEMNLGEPVYNLNNIYRIHLLGGSDPLIVAFELENLPGVHLAYPVALPPELPLATDYTPNQNYLDPASSTPTGVNAYYAWTQTGGDGSGVTICDLEYSWNYNHSDVTKALASQINFNVGDPFNNTDHGTGVIGELVSNNNTWGTTGVA